MPHQKIRVAIVGCGRISGKHLEAYKDLNDRLEFVAACDRSQEKRAKVAAEFDNKIALYNDIDEMLSKEKIDLLTISAPNGLHPTLAIKAAGKVRNIVTEKPMSITLADGQKMLDACHKNNTKLFVIYQNRFNPTIQALNRAIETGRFGKIFMITSNVFWQRSDEYYTKDATWHGTKDLDGGAYYTQASHYVDLIQWFARSKPKRVFASLGTLARKIETEDCGMAIIDWDNGIISNLNVTVLTYPKNLEGSITIIGEKGTVKIGGIALNKVEQWEFAEKSEDDKMVFEQDYDTDSVYGNGHTLNYSNIIEAISLNKTGLIEGEEGIKSVRILESIMESHHKKQIVNF